MLNRLLLYSAAENNVAEAIQLFESSQRDDKPEAAVTFSDFIRAVLCREVGVGAPHTWNLVLKSMINCLLIYHEKGQASQWHSKLLVEALLGYNPKDSRFKMKTTSYPSEIAKEVASLYAGGSNDFVISPLGVSALDSIGAEVKFKSRGAERLAGSLAHCLGVMEGWAETMVCVDPPLVMQGIKLMTVIDPEVAAKCLIKAKEPLITWSNQVFDETVTTLMSSLYETQILPVLQQELEDLNQDMTIRSFARQLKSGPLCLLGITKRPQTEPPPNSQASFPLIVPKILRPNVANIIG